MFPVGSGSSSLGVTLRLLTNSYEPGTTQLLEAVLRPGMTVVDIGAHVGYFTLLASRLVGPTGRVFAFEPEPHTFDLLQRNIAVNGLLNVVPVKKAVAGRTGELKLFLCLQGSDRNSLFEPSDRGQSVNIDAVAVDEFWLALGCPTFDLLKIDAEGAESSVIEGMTSVLARCGVCRMIVELNPLALDRAGANPLRLLQMIGDSNFAIQEIKDDGPLRAIEPSEYPVLLQDLRQRKESINLFCVHHENGPNLQRRPVKTRTEMLG